MDIFPVNFNISIQDIEKVESYTKKIFHNSFKEFLLNRYIRIPEKKYFLVNKEAEYFICCIEKFYNLEEIKNVWEYTNSHSDLNDTDLYLIAETLGKSCLAMNLTGEIYLWDEDFGILKCFENLNALFRSLKNDDEISIP